MSIEFKENNKRLLFDVLGYEFPHIKKDCDSYDANWLTVSISYADPNLSFNDRDNCLLSFELEQMTEAIDAIAEGKETGTIQTFLEPYLTFSVTGTGSGYAFQIRFVYDTADGIWKDVYICQEMSLSELIEMNNEFKAIYAKYPCRETEK